MSIAPSDLPKDEAKSVAPIPVPTHGAGGNFAVACSTTIAGPALSCLEKVLDLSSYGTWNTFVPSASLTTPGTTDELPVTSELRDIASRPGYVAPGAKVRFNAVMMTPGGGGGGGASSSSSTRAVDLEVTFLETFITGDGKMGYRVAWKALGIPHFLLHSERVQEFIEDVAKDGKPVTRYACWETFGGVLGYVLPKAQIESGFQRWMDGLKKVVEEGR
ncbi:hypothetical protein FHL15_011043 [Xylaria flabelliformis]|uniref:Uncharacterized protein n=1 Tax=Xylaria flabelliformis TaxID=2512241 RepID=A0A553HJB4_9PEZI|nr:hypothetical protein FHL15_011043 [Xylaria flabelliformis]